MKPMAVFQEGETVFFCIFRLIIYRRIIKNTFFVVYKSSPINIGPPTIFVALAVTLTPFISPKDDPAPMNSN